MIQLVISCQQQTCEEFRSIISDIGALIPSPKKQTKLIGKKVSITQKNIKSRSPKGIDSLRTSKEQFVFGSENGDVVNKYIALLEYLRKGEK